MILMEIEIKNSCEIPIRALPWEQGICTQKRSSPDSPLQLLLQRGSSRCQRFTWHLLGDVRPAPYAAITI